MNWTTAKPEFDREFVFVTATLSNDRWIYWLWQVMKVDNGESGWYYGLCDQSGEEWGDIEDLRADKYLILPKHE